MFFPDSIVYIQNGDSLNDSLDIRKKLDKNSKYFDALTSLTILLDYIQGDSLECHELIKKGSMTLFVDNRIIYARLNSIEYKKINYGGREIMAEEVGIIGCPDDKTEIKVLIGAKKIISIRGIIHRSGGIDFKVNYKEK